MTLTFPVKSTLPRLLLLPCLILAQLFLQPAKARPHQPENEPSSCVTAEMARQIVQERDGIRVSAPRDDGNEAAVRENAKGIAATKAPENAHTMEEAHKRFQKAARWGYAPAQVNLAVLSLAGWGTRANAGEALYWLCEAAQQGYTPAIFDLGVMYLQGCGVRRDYGEAFHFFEKGAKRGDPAAQMNLGYLYDQGLGVAKNRLEAAKWYRLAADQDEPRAQYNLGDLYLRGEGVVRDEPAALEWFRKAAYGGHPEARIMLGGMYAAGRGTAVDLAAAYMWLALAALQGDSRANARLNEVKSQLTTEQLVEATGRAQSLAQKAHRPMWQSPFH